MMPDTARLLSRTVTQVIYLVAMKGEVEQSGVEGEMNVELGTCCKLQSNSTLNRLFGASGRMTS